MKGRRAGVRGASLLADMHIDQRPYATAAIVFADRFARLARVHEPEWPLLADPERLAVGFKRKDVVGAVDVLWQEIASVAVCRDERSFHLGHFDKTQDLVQDRPLESRFFLELNGFGLDRALWQAKQHELKSVLEVGVQLRE